MVSNLNIQAQIHAIPNIQIRQFQFSKYLNLIHSNQFNQVQRDLATHNYGIKIQTFIQIQIHNIWITQIPKSRILKLKESRHKSPGTNLLLFPLLLSKPTYKTNLKLRTQCCEFFWFSNLSKKSLKSPIKSPMNLLFFIISLNTLLLFS